MVRGVCIVSPGGWHRKGGIESYSRTLATRLPQAFPGMRTYLLDSRGDRHIALSPFFLALAALRLTGLALARRADVAHIQISERGSYLRKGFLVVLARLFRLRVILHHHGAEAIDTYHAGPAALSALMRLVVRAAHMNVVLGSQWRTWLIEELSVAPERVRILYNAIEDLPDAPLPVAGGTTGAPFRPILLAVLSDRKGVGDFLTALAALKAGGIPLAATIGGGGPDLPRFRQMAGDLGLGAECDFPGWVAPAEVADALARHDCYVLPSYREGLPVGILEAMRAARPVIATDVGSIAEAIPAGSGVTIVSPGDTAALADALTRLALSAETRRTEGAAARAAYEARFRLSSHLDRLVAIYDPGGERATRAARSASGGVAKS